MNIKVDINLAAVQIMWLFLMMKITLVGQSVWMIFELTVCMSCTIYVITNIKYVPRNALMLVIALAMSYLVSTLVNRECNGPWITYTGVEFTWKIILYFTVSWIAIKKRGSNNIAKASWNCLMLYWVPSIITVFAQGRNVIDNANNVYFIGNKFNVAYLNVVMLCLLLFLNNERKENCSRSFVLKINSKKIGVFLFYAMIVFIDYYMKAYTGLFMILFILILAILSRYLQFRIAKKWSGFLNFIGKPLIVTISVVASGLVAIILEAIMNIPTIGAYLASIGKTGNILSRTLIYKNLAEIIERKPLIGYGYGSAIVSRYFGPNAQNGLAQVMIYTGILGTFLMLLITFYCCKAGRQSKGSQSAAFLYAIYAFILSATVEITYGGTFFILLAFYCACGWEKKLSRGDMYE